MWKSKLYTSMLAWTLVMGAFCRETYIILMEGRGVYMCVYICYVYANFSYMSVCVCMYLKPHENLLLWRIWPTKITLITSMSSHLRFDNRFCLNSFGYFLTRCGGIQGWDGKKKCFVNFDAVYHLERMSYDCCNIVCYCCCCCFIR